MMTHIEKLQKIGDVFADKLLETENINARVALIYMQLIEKSWEMAYKFSIPNDPLQLFVRMLENNKYKQSELFENYVNFCTISGFEPLGRNTFYAQLENDFGFKSVKSDGNRVLIAPKSKRSL